MTPEYTYSATSPEPGFQERARDLFSFDGRLGRQSYWLRALLLWGVNLLVTRREERGNAADAGAA